MHFRILPHVLLAAAVLVAVAVGLLAGWLARQQPWLGVRLQTTGGETGALVVAVDAEGPSATILTPNDIILRIRGPAGEGMVLTAADLEPDPDVFPSFAELNRFLERQGRLVDLLSRPVVIFDLEDGRSVQVQPSFRRPLEAFPAGFWLINLMGMLAFCIGFAVWLARRGSAAPRMLCGLGCAYLLLTVASSVVIYRELALAPGWHRLLQATYHAGNDLFTVFGIALLASYPVRLVRWPLLPPLFLLVLPFWLNERFQWLELPGHSVLFQVPVYFAVAIVVSLLQWWQARKRPVSRAIFRWFHLAMLLCVSLSAIIYFVPMLIAGHAVVPIWVGFGTVLLLFFGLAMGVCRYRLFELDRWWFDLWLWFLAGAALLAIDILLIFVVSLAPPVALALAMLLVGWLYFPCRQWLWNRLFRSSRRRIEQVLPSLMTGLLEQRGRKTQALERALRELFQPASFAREPAGGSGTALLDEGEALLVPLFDRREGLVLRYRDRGARLFSPADVRMADTLREIVQLIEDRIRVYNRGVSEERERIMRDLHDDVGGRLLSLIHTAATPHQEALARDALGSLREIIYSLNSDEQVRLGDALGKWRYECRQRCERAGVSFEWQVPCRIPERLLTPRQWVNLSRVLYEAASNAFTHAEPSFLAVDWRLEGDDLHCRIRNDGRMPQAVGRRGKGLRNMELRLKEIGGMLQHRLDGAGRFFEICFQVPIVSQEG